MKIIAIFAWINPARQTNGLNKMHIPLHLKASTCHQIHSSPPPLPHKEIPAVKKLRILRADGFGVLF